MFRALRFLPGLIGACLLGMMGVGPSEAEINFCNWVRLARVTEERCLAVPHLETWVWGLALALMVATLGLFLFAKWKRAKAIPQERRAEITEDSSPRQIQNDPKIIWNDHLGHTYMSHGSTIHTHEIRITGVNGDKDVELRDLFIVSGATGEKLRLTVGTRDGGWIEAESANLVPPKAVVTLKAEFNPPTGLPAHEFVEKWSSIRFYENGTLSKVFDEGTVRAMYASFRPYPIGPSVTPRK